MAVVENGGIILFGSSNRTDTFDVAQNDDIGGDHCHLTHPSTKTMTALVPPEVNSTKSLQSTDANCDINLGIEEPKINTLQKNTANGQLPTVASNQESQNSMENNQQQESVKSDFKDGNFHLNNGQGVDVEGSEGGDGGVVNHGSDGFNKEMRDLEEMLSKLNPMAKEFVPPSLGTHNHLFMPPPAAGHFGYGANGFIMPNNAGIPNGNFVRRKKSSYNNGKRRLNSRTSLAQQEEVIRRTVYVSDIDHQVTEEQLATLFLHCGQVVDCRVCGDPNSVLRFAFIEFTDEEGAFNALSLSGTMLGFYPVKVQPSKTAIAPVNPTFLPQSEDEREMCARTIYCTNIDKKVTPAEVKLFFESMCGEVQRLRLLGDYHHSTRIAFVEFVMAESAIAALNCSGAIIGSLPLRVSPSKTPVRSRPPRQIMH